MPTGACGIDCDVCRLNLLGMCSTCGSGRSPEGLKKFAAQHRILGAPCPILACSVENRVEYCTRDCDRFPCERFKNGPYPFSHGFLNMHKRRRKESPPLKSPAGYGVEVSSQHWEDLNALDIATICENAIARNDPDNGIMIPFLKEYLLIDMKQRCLYRQVHGDWEIADNPLLELLCLTYLLHAGPEPINQKMVGVNELRTAHFFRGVHELKTMPLVELYGNDLDGFKRAAEGLGGEFIDIADAAYMLRAFPKVPLYYLFWRGDEEFLSRITILFDSSIEQHLSTDGIWGLVNLVSNILLMGDERHM
ncbi:DUF3786 domain-containing protein [Thermodesulfobacteriota bacterium]